MQASTKTDFSDPSEQRQMALSQWDNDGGAEPFCGREDVISGEVRPEERPMTNTELVQLHVRVIALENLVIALLAESSDRHLELARDMAAYISPRPGATRHPMTLHAAARMTHLLNKPVFFEACRPAEFSHRVFSGFANAEQQWDRRDASQATHELDKGGSASLAATAISAKT